MPAPQFPSLEHSQIVGLALNNGGDAIKAFGHVGDALASEPKKLLKLLNLMTMDALEADEDGYGLNGTAFLLGEGLTALRYRVDGGDKIAAANVDAIRARLALLIAEDKMDIETAALAARQFREAKLEVGSAVENAMQKLLDDWEGSEDLDPREMLAQIAQVAKQFKNDVFAFQATFAKQGEGFPETQRAVMPAALLLAPDEILREAAIGWLADPSATVRNAVANVLLEAADRGGVSGTMLRRITSMRNWLPADEHSGIDRVIETCRGKGVAFKQPFAAIVLDTAATLVDGAGAQSLLMTVKDGGKCAILGVLTKTGFGIRDTWTEAGLNKGEIKRLRQSIKDQTPVWSASMAYIRMALSHALWQMRQAGTVPPFALLDITERAGIGVLNPNQMTVEALIEDLKAGLPPASLSEAAMEAAIAGSRFWYSRLPSLDSWFEDDREAIGAVVKGKRSPQAREDAVLAAYLPEQRHYWAEKLAWCALSMRDSKDAPLPWQDLALVALAIEGGYALSGIPLMRQIAATTVYVWQAKAAPRQG
jgi:hypothetical protein